MKSPLKNKLIFIKNTLMMLIIGILVAIPTTSYMRISDQNNTSVELALEANDLTSDKDKEYVNIAAIESVQLIIDEQLAYEEKINSLLNVVEQNHNLISFYATMYNIPVDIIKEDIKNKVIEHEFIDENNLGFITDETGNLLTNQNKDLAFLNYIELFISNHPEYESTTIIPYTGSKEYVEALIAYFTNIYTNVDYTIAISIGAAESGYYTAGGMLGVNNVFGGMAGGRLIRYPNIEQGVLKYIRLLNDNYFAKGLNTVESIGYVFCPRIEEGIKVASSHWIQLVNKAKENYNMHNIRSIDDVWALK